jgi:hypothetical protein
MPLKILQKSDFPPIHVYHENFKFKWFFSSSFHFKNALHFQPKKKMINDCWIFRVSDFFIQNNFSSLPGKNLKCVDGRYNSTLWVLKNYKNVKFCRVLPRMIDS